MAPYIDLSGARATLEAVLFQDSPTTVRVTFDAQAFADDTFDKVTGLWTRPPGDETLVYEGAAAVKGMDPERLFEIGTVMNLRAEWALRLPLTAPTVPVGSICEITGNVRDPSIVGRRYRVDRQLGSTFGVVGRYVMFEFKPQHGVLP